MKNKIACLVPAAGKGIRSGLVYPKTLFKVNSIPIIIRILKKINIIDTKPTIVINKKFSKLFLINLKKYNTSAELIFQNQPLGMGNAVLQYNKSKKKDKYDDILLIWGDIPFLQKSTIKKLIKFHYDNKNQIYYAKLPEIIKLSLKKLNLKEPSMKYIEKYFNI